MRSDTDKNRRGSNRLPGYNYSQPGAYFVTVCTQHRAALFGAIEDGEMRLNDAGRAAEECWSAIPEHFQRTKLDEFVIMPNHIHGLVIILDPGRGTACRAPTVPASNMSAYSQQLQASSGR